MSVDAHQAFIQAWTLVWVIGLLRRDYSIKITVAERGRSPGLAFKRGRLNGRC